MLLLNITPLILSCMFYLSLVRATNIALFYPSDERQLSSIDYTQQTLMNIMLLLLLVGYIFLKNNYDFARIIMRKPVLVCFLIGGVISVIFSINPIESLKFILAVIVISFPTVIYAQTYGVQKLLEKMALFVIAMVFINLLYTLAFPQFAIMTGNHDGRWKGLFQHKNIFGPFFAIGIFIIWNQFHNLRRQWLKVIAAISMFLCLAFIFKAGSATALVIFFLMVLSYISFTIGFKMHPRERVFLFLTVFSSVLLIGTFLGPMISSVFFDLTGRDATLTGRTGIWAVLMESVWESPIIGYGAGMSQRPEFMKDFQGDIGWEAHSAHNSYIDLFLNFGIPLSILILFQILKPFIKGILGTYKNREIINMSVLSSALFVVAFTISFASSEIFVNRTTFWLFTVVALNIYYCIRLETRNKSISAAAGQKNANGFKQDHDVMPK